MKPGLTKKQRRKLGRYVRHIADTLNLRDWTFTLVHAPIPDDEKAWARVDCTFGRRHADIEFCAGFDKLPRNVQRHVVTHELLHCHLDPMENILANSLAELIGKPAQVVAVAAYTQDMEFAVDTIADAVGKLLPLPPKLD